MSESTKAVFLSYASQDADTARRICDALRAAGVEVWFDQSELVGGDQWDAKIRQQISSCALFVPLISANTQARLEGYFRLEWKLAAQRTHTMADEKPFLLPILLDATREPEAKVPAEFRAVQWTKLPGGETPPGFVSRVQRLLNGETFAAGGPASAVELNAGGRSGSATPATTRNARWTRPVLGAAVIVIAALAVTLARKPGAPAAPALTPAVAASPEEDAAAREIAAVRAKLRPDEWTRADFDAFVPVSDRLLRAYPENGDAWALRSIANSLLVIRNLDSGTKPLETGKEAADRALRLAPGSPLAELSLGLHLVAMISRGGDAQACRVHVDRALAALPVEPLTRYAELASYWLGYQMEGTERAARGWLAAEPHASFPAWILAQYSLVRRQPADAEKWAAQAAADADITGIRSLVTLFESRYYLQADLAAARAAIDRVPPGQRGVHRVVAVRWLLAMAEQHYDLALQELARTPEAMLRDRVYHGPKALLAGMAHQGAGRAEAARAQFEEAEKGLRTELAADPENQELRAGLALTLACLGRATDARRELAAVEPLMSGQSPSVYIGEVVALIAQAHGVLGDIPGMLPWLRYLLAEKSQLPFTAPSLRLDPRFARYAAEPSVQALLAELAPKDAGTAAIDAKSVAVLAFANLSEDKANEYFSDGISEELLNVLTKVPGLKVTARTSSFYFKGRSATVTEIGTKLGVASLIEGSVQRSGNRVKVTARLSRTDTGEERWSRSYTRELQDVFALQEELALAIVGELRGQLGLGDTAAVKTALKGGTTNPQALQAYLLGQFHRLRNTEKEMIMAIAEYRRAVELDPRFALAWAGLSESHTWITGFGSNMDRATFASHMEQARTAAARSLELVPDLPEALLARTICRYNFDLDWKGAAADAARIRALAPGMPEVYIWSGQIAQATGDLAAADAFFRQAVALDPVNGSARGFLAFNLAISGDVAGAAEEYARTREINPDAPWSHAGQGLALLLAGRYEEAVTSSAGEPAEWARQLLVALARHAQGRHPEADAALAELKKGAADVAAYQIAEVHAYRGEKDEAFAWLERSRVQLDGGIGLARADPLLKSLHADPRWLAWLRSVGLADEQLK